MKENVFDILIYLFEHYTNTALDFEPRSNRAELKQKLERAGFAERTVEHAFDWLAQLSHDPKRIAVSATPNAIRVFAANECARLDLGCRDYVLHLENIGILSSTQRELVIDRLIALDTAEIDIDQVKWVVLMVLFSQPGQEMAYWRMENLVFSDLTEMIH